MLLTLQCRRVNNESATENMYVDTPEVRALVSHAFPNYNGKRFQVQPFQGPMRLDSYWSGGSRDYWAAVKLNGQTATVPENGTPFTPEVGELRELPENTALIQYHMGNYEYAVVYVRPENMNQLALPPAVVLTRCEQIVLVATASLKSSYAGIKDYRFQEAKASTGITESEWFTAKGSCQAKGLLNKAGAITNDGRNAVSGVRLESFAR